MAKASAERDFLFSSGIPSNGSLPEAGALPIPEVEQGEEVPMVAKLPIPLEDVREKIAKREAERAVRWDELDGKNYTPEQIERELRDEFPDLISSEAVEEADKKADAAARRAKHASMPKPPIKRTRRGLSPRGLLTADEPPPHIVRQNRGEE